MLWQCTCPPHARGHRASPWGARLLSLPPACMQVKDYPGLLRVIAWVINGLDLLVENAK